MIIDNQFNVNMFLISIGYKPKVIPIWMGLLIFLLFLANLPRFLVCNCITLLLRSFLVRILKKLASFFFILFHRLISLTAQTNLFNMYTLQFHSITCINTSAISKQLKNDIPKNKPILLPM